MKEHTRSHFGFYLRSDTEAITYMTSLHPTVFPDLVEHLYQPTMSAPWSVFHWPLDSKSQQRDASKTSLLQRAITYSSKVLEF
jgi:hypothetical protein